MLWQMVLTLGMGRGVCEGLVLIKMSEAATWQRVRSGIELTASIHAVNSIRVLPQRQLWLGYFCDA